MHTVPILSLLLSCLLYIPVPARAESVRIPVWTQPGQVLQADELIARVGGEPVSVVRLHGPGDEMIVLLILDLVGDLNRIELARQGLVHAVSEATSNTHVGVLSAQGGLRVLLDPTNDSSSLAEVIRSFPVSGTPGLLETIESASGLADSILRDSPLRIALFYVTDSEIDEYRENFTNPVVNDSDSGDLSRRFPEGLVRDRVSRLATKLSASQAPIFVVHLDYETDRLDEAYQTGILQMATTTGGDAVFCRSDSEIPKAIQSMWRKIATHYAVDVQVPPGGRGTALISLESASSGKLDYRSR